jgi:hypothetical protein
VIPSHARYHKCYEGIDLRLVYVDVIFITNVHATV